MSWNPDYELWREEALRVMKFNGMQISGTPEEQEELLKAIYEQEYLEYHGLVEYDP